MSVGCDHRVLEVIRVIIVLVAEIEPGVGKLMYEQWRRRRNVLSASINHFRSPHSIPAFRRNGVGWRSDGEQIQHHGFAIRIPSQPAKAMLGLPVESESIAAVERPRPLNPVENCGRVTIDSGNLKVFPAGKNTAEQDRIIDRRDFRGPCPFSSRSVHEVI